MNHMLNLLKRLVGNIGERKSGFTLVELLIVVAIIVALGAVIVPNVLQFADRGDTGAQAAERDAVQAAMDAMMADVGITAVTAQANPDNSNNAWGALPAEGALQPFLREASTTYFYCWDATGLVTQQDTAAAACP
jgi:prepilin-type N-terminal cleavage/methylation domain-containing protein